MPSENPEGDNAQFARVFNGTILISGSAGSAVWFCLNYEKYDLWELLFKSILFGFPMAVAILGAGLIIGVYAREIAFKERPYSYKKIALAALWGVSCVFTWGFYENRIVQIIFGLIWTSLVISFLLKKTAKS